MSYSIKKKLHTNLMIYDMKKLKLWFLSYFKSNFYITKCDVCVSMSKLVKY